MSSVLGTDRVAFGPFVLDRREARLWRDGSPVEITPRSLAVLEALLDRPGELITKDDLVARVWPRTVVTDAAVAKRVQELRTALGDDPREPRYVQTFYRRGFKFVGSLALERVAAEDFVGRVAALAQLRRGMESALAGRRATLLITGEAGIGKTRLVTRFFGESVDPNAQIARGQCAPHGEGRPFLPVVAALMDLAGTAPAAVQEQICRVAPAWAAMLGLSVRSPALVPDAQNQYMLLRQLSNALDVFSRDRALVILLEDLHWADPSTIAAIDHFARVGSPGRVLTIATLRDGVLDPDRAHVWRDIAGHLGRDGFSEIRLGRLTEPEVRSYLAHRFDAAFADQYARHVHARAGGLPLFTAWLADWMRDAVADGTASADLADGLPNSLIRLFELQLTALDHASLPVIEVASVLGVTFSLDTLADLLDQPRQVTDELCRDVLRSSCLLTADGGVGARRLSFTHALLRDALYRRIDPARLRRLHSRCARVLLAGDGNPAEVAHHHARAGECLDAARWHLAAGRAALGSHGFNEARRHFEEGVAQLQSPIEGSGDEHDRTEIDLRLGLGHCFVATEGYARPTVKFCYERARALAGGCGTPEQRFAATQGVVTYLTMRGQLGEATLLCEELLTSAAGCADASMLARALAQRAEHTFYRGDLAGATADLERVEAMLEEHRADPIVWTSWSQVGIGVQEYLGHIECEQGKLDTALARSEALLVRLAQHPQPYAVCMAHYFATGVHIQRDEFDAAVAHADAMIDLSKAHGMQHPVWLGEMVKGYLCTLRGDHVGAVARIEPSLVALDASGTVLSRVIAMDALARALAGSGEIERAVALLDEADGIVARTGEILRHAQLALARAEVLKCRDAAASPAVIDALEQALANAEAQGLRVWQLRALMRLAPTSSRYRAQLAELLGAMPEGHGTPLLRAARRIAT